MQLFNRSYALNISEINEGEQCSRLAALSDVEEEGHRAEASALRDMLQILSHEIMNSLTPVSSLAQTAVRYLDRDKGPDVTSAREALEVLTRRAASLTSFIDGYRSLARMPMPSVQRVDVKALLCDILLVFQQGESAKGLHLETQLPIDSVWLQLDEGLFSQALLNLLNNAAEATFQNAGARMVTLSVEVEHDSVEIWVSDNGPGIANDQRTKIFRPFVTTKVNGSGIGLSLAHQIVAAHGGDLYLRDSAGDGLTVFVMSLKAGQAAKQVLTDGNVTS